MKKRCTLSIPKLLLASFIVVLSLSNSSVQGQMVTVTPAEYPNALTNPLMGFRKDLNDAGDQNYKYTSVVRHYIKWNEIENSESDGVQKIISFCNQKWANLPAYNVKVVPRVYVDWDSNSGNENWPADILTQTGLAPDDPNLWKTEIVRNRIVKLIEKLGQAWDNDPRVAWVQTGIVGYWGEQENPVGVDDNVIAPDNSNYAKIMGKAYETALPNKIKLVRNHQYFTAEGYKDLGMYWDSFAHTGQYTGAWSSIKNVNNLNPGRYLLAPMEGEVAYDWGDGRNNFAKLESDGKYYPNSTLSNAQYYNFIINTIKQLHTSALGWIASYTPGPATDVGVNLVQKAFGYRFLITEFSCSARTEPGSSLTINAKVKNIGSAVFHENWPVAFILVNESTRKIVHQSVINGTDTRLWQPGSNYDWDPNSNPNGTKVYLTPAVDNQINGSVVIPNTITPGKYLAGLAIIDPSTQKPGVFFAVNSFFKESQSQPLCRIGIGVDAVDNVLTGPFNHPVNDDTRTYTLFSPSKYTITALAGSNGLISPSGSTEVNKGASQTYTIAPNSGYEIDEVVVNGVAKGKISTYTFPSVKGYYTISATYKLIGSNVSVSPIGAWMKGTTHVKETGSKRAFVVMLYGEGSGDISASSVTYGGQTMTKVIEKSYQNGSYSYTGAFVLNEAGIAAANSETIAVTWSSAPSTGSEITSAFFSNVNQNTLTGAMASNGISGTTITTTDLTNSSGDMVIVGGTAANDGSYTINNGFSRGIDETSATFGDITSAYKIATGVPETPSLTISTSMRQSILGFVLKKTDINSISTIKAENNIKVYPNPAVDLLKICFTNAESIKEVNIFNSNGKLIFSKKSADATTSIDVKSLKYKGIAVLQVVTNKQVQTQKVLIM